MILQLLCGSAELSTLLVQATQGGLLTDLCDSDRDMRRCGALAGVLGAWRGVA